LRNTALADAKSRGGGGVRLRFPRSKQGFGIGVRFMPHVPGTVVTIRFVMLADGFGLWGEWPGRRIRASLRHERDSGWQEDKN
jgi:hypothetical protein